MDDAPDTRPPPIPPAAQRFLLQHYQRLTNPRGKLASAREQAAVEHGLEGILKAIESGHVNATTPLAYIATVYKSRRNQMFKKLARERKHAEDVIIRKRPHINVQLEELLQRVMRAWLTEQKEEVLLENKTRRASVRQIAQREHSTPERIRGQVNRSISRLRKEGHDLAGFAEQYLQKHGIPLFIIEAVLRLMDETAKLD